MAAYKLPNCIFLSSKVTEDVGSSESAEILKIRSELESSFKREASASTRGSTSQEIDSVIK